MDLETLEKYCKENTTFENRTRRYLAPIFNKDEQMLKIRKDYTVVAYGLYDINCPDLFIKDSIGILINARDSKQLSFKHPLIVDNYYYGELLYGKLHMVIVKFPEKYYGVLDKFKQGKYSEMFTNPKEIYIENEVTIFKDFKGRCLDICTKNPKLKEKLEKKLQVNIEGELDNIFNPKEEIFNYGK